MVSPTFESWISWAFDHPLTDPAWYWGVDAPEMYLSSALKVAFYTRLMKNCGTLLLPRFSEEQINQGLWFLCSSDRCELTSEDVSWAKRTACIRSFYCLYEKLFFSHCSESLGNIDEPGCRPLNSICYMLWDLLPYDTESEVIKVLRRSLEFPHAAIQESALHGLGHFHHVFPKKVHAIIEQFLRHGKPRNAQVIDYAQQAAIGHVC